MRRSESEVPNEKKSREKGPGVFSKAKSLFKQHEDNNDDELDCNAASPSTNPRDVFKSEGHMRRKSIFGNIKNVALGVSRNKKKSGDDDTVVDRESLGNADKKQSLAVGAMKDMFHSAGEMLHLTHKHSMAGDVEDLGRMDMHHNEEV